MALSRCIRNAFVMATAAVLVGFLAANVSATTFGSYSAQLYSIVRVKEYRWTHAVWIHFDYPMSVACSAYPSCYAKSQWTYAYVSCPLRSVALIREISMDLNGSVVADHIREGPPTFVRSYRLQPSGGFPNASLRVLETVCGYPPDRD